MKWKKIVYKMAEEIGSLRFNQDLEWGEESPKEYYDEKEIIKEYIKEIESE